jgi:hypothetical protein
MTDPKQNNQTVSGGLGFDLEYCSKNYLDFRLAAKHNPATWIIDVFAKDAISRLGQIRWYAHWRQYAFYPNIGTVYEKTCLTDITEMCRRLNVIQRAGIKPQQTLRRLRPA